MVRPDKPFSVRFPPDVLAMLRVNAKRRKLSVGQLIVQYVIAHRYCERVKCVGSKLPGQATRPYDC